MTLNSGLVRLVAATELLRPDGVVQPGARFLCTHGEAAQLLTTGLARHDERERDVQRPGPWTVRKRR